MTELKLLEALKVLAEHCDGMEAQHNDYHELGEGGIPRRSQPLVEAYTAIEEWESRPLPAAGADPEVVEAARRVNVAIKSIAGKRIPIKFPNDEIAMVFTTIIENAGKVARALLANATDEMPPARRAEGEQPSTSYVRTEK